MSGGSGSNGWNKQSWIKDVLSKSGTDIVEVKEEKPKEIGTMVYYPSLPLIMKSETKKQQLLCSPLATTDPQTYQAAIALHRPRHQQQQQQQPNQPQQLRQPISNNVMLTTNHSPSSSLNSTPTTSTSSTTATLLISQSQNFLQNIKIELPQQSFHHHLQQQQHHAQQQLQPIDLQQTQNQQNGGSGGRMEAVSASQKVLYKCDQCMMNFGSKSAHTSHMKSHVKIENNYQSTATTESLGLSTGLGNGTVNPPSQNGTSATPNQGTSTGSDPYQCNVCKKTFAVPARLIRHYRTHTGERPFECEFCHKMFSVKENLQVHRRIHTKERPYKCDVCGRAFEHSGKLHRHMRIHTGERPHKCSVCSKTFIQSGQLVIHMRTHTGEKPYKCPVEGCGKGFTCSKQLKVHSRTHTGEKPYHCDICFRDFGYNHVLKLHRVQHYGSKCYKCTICDETFKSKKEMEAHIKRHANEMPDDDEEQQTQQQSGQLSPSISKQDAMSNSNANTSPAPQTQRRSPVRQKQQRQQQQRQQPRYTRRESLPDSERSHDSSTPSTNGSILIETPIDTGSEATSEGEEAGTNNSLYNNTNLYQRLGPSGLPYALNSSRPTINPALLAAATIASRRVESESHNGRASPMETGQGMPSQILDEMDTSPSNEVLDFYHKPLDTVSIVNDMPGPVVPRGSQMPMPYEPLAVMKQNGYFAPAPVPEFRPSIRAANDIVRRVEAAIAGAEPLLTPPRLSSTESPERSSSPESDSLILADRDVMTLPLRKRKLYMSDNQAQDVSPVMRMSSVIQFAKAS